VAAADAWVAAFWALASAFFALVRSSLAAVNC
jgi:hypothetical protein